MHFKHWVANLLNFEGIHLTFIETDLSGLSLPETLSWQFHLLSQGHLTPKNSSYSKPINLVTCLQPTDRAHETLETPVPCLLLSPWRPPRPPFKCRQTAPTTPKIVYQSPQPVKKSI